MRALVVASLLLVGCAHGVANEERIDADRKQGELDEALIQGLLRMDCRTASGELTQARDESQSDGKRQAAYQRAIVVLEAMTDRYGTELEHNADLAYSSRAEQLEVAQRRCRDQLSLVKRERVRFEAGVASSAQSESESVAAAAPAPRPPPVASKHLRHAAKKSRYAKAKARGHRHDVAVAQAP